MVGLARTQYYLNGRADRIYAPRRKLFCPRQCVVYRAVLFDAGCSLRVYVALPDAHRHSYPYDLPSLALLVGCIYYLLSKKYLQFWVFFVLATLSRETSILVVAFAIIIYVTENHRLTRSQLALVVLLLVAWGMIKVFLKLLYADNLFEDTNMNEGGFFVFQLLPNVRSLIDPIRWPNFLAFCGFLYIPIILGWKWLNNITMRRSILSLDEAKYIKFNCRLDNCDVYGWPHYRTSGFWRVDHFLCHRRGNRNEESSGKAGISSV